MSLHFIDIAIIAAFLLTSVLVGYWVSHRASRDMKAYFLGGNTMPWYILGVSNASGMFDISGTMLLVYWMFVYGLKSVWIPWLWPTFNQVFLMVFLSAWLRRSNVMTGAEWIQTRFGKNAGSTASHISVVIFAVVSVIGFLAYGAKGVGKFAYPFMPWKSISPDTYALIIMGITTFYVVKGGMFSVVFTEVIQFCILTIASIAVGIIAMMKVSPEALQAVVPSGWYHLLFGWHLTDMDWGKSLSAANQIISSDGYSLFGIFFMMMLFKGILVSAAGPAPNYDMQRILSTRGPREAALMSSTVNVVLFFSRYMMITGLTILALAFFTPQLAAMGTKMDPEEVLPESLARFVPVGILGFLIAGLLAAFMSNFAATVNAAPAYLVNDIYKRFINPHAPARRYVTLSYLASFGVVVVGVSFGYITQSINSAMQWIVNGLWGGYMVSNVLKWYWWRFNGWGYFWGMVTGIGSALVLPLVMPLVLSLLDPSVRSLFGDRTADVMVLLGHPITSFPLILVISLAGALIGTYMNEPENDAVLMEFYRRVRPWGFWGPVHEKVVKADPGFQRNKDFYRDMFNIAVGIVWQTCFVLAAMYFVTRNWRNTIISLVVLAITFVILKKTWYNRLPPASPEPPPDSETHPGEVKSAAF